jgi:hypothetical protein
MLTKSAKRQLLAVAVYSASLASAFAGPVVVDFESAPPLTVVGPTQPDQSYQESGVPFTPSGGDALVDMSFCAVGAEFCITNNNTVYLTAINGAEVTMSADRWFTLDSLDAAFYPTPSVNFTGYSFGLSLLGTLWGGGTVQATLSLLEDVNSAGDFLFSSFGGLGSAQLSSVTFGACVFDAGSCVRNGAMFGGANGLLFNDLEFAIDNLAVSIPEPSALWLVALGIAGLASTRRRVTR